jgi:4a-hydroxytetrahydrobiopterin dehydratase
MSNSLTAQEVTDALAQLSGWTWERDALAKTYTFKSFREAMSFMTRVAFEAEELNHHPDWSNTYNRVEVRLSTHDAGDKVTAKDVALAKRFEKISWVV